MTGGHQWIETGPTPGYSFKVFTLRVRIEYLSAFIPCTHNLNLLLSEYLLSCFQTLIYNFSIWKVSIVHVKYWILSNYKAFFTKRLIILWYYQSHRDVTQFIIRPFCSIIIFIFFVATLTKQNRTNISLYIKLIKHKHTNLLLNVANIQSTLYMSLNIESIFVVIKFKTNLI